MKVFKTIREAVYGISLSKAWNDFIQFEKKFQEQNIKRIQQSPITKVEPLSDKTEGWVTRAYLDHSDTSVIFGFHHPNHLASIQKLKLSSHKPQIIGTLPSLAFLILHRQLLIINRDFFFILSIVILPS